MDKVAKSEKIEIGQPLTDDLIRRGAAILSRMQGCEDPSGQRCYYEGLFKDLMEELASEFPARSVSG